MARHVLPVAGAAIGFVLGGPVGAQIGWTIGSVVGNAVDPQVIRGPSVGDLTAQTSQEGVPRPMVWALSPPMGGNIIATSEPRIVRETERQGKWGPKFETETIFRTYAIGVCEGPITGFIRVWRNGKLEYDADDPEFNEDRIITVPGFGTINLGSRNSRFLETARLFTGAWDQLPSPDLEAIFGVGSTPAHRGTAYMVMADEDLTDMRGAIPQFTFQVSRCEGFFLTSQPYPAEAIDALASSGDVTGGSTVVARSVEYSEALDSTGDVTGGSLGGSTQYQYPEAIESWGDVTGGVFILPTEYELTEALDSTGDVTGGTFTESVPYGYEEALASTGDVTGGTLA